MASLLLAIELFNRPSDLGRQEAVLIHANHALELLLKAVIVHRGGRIRSQRETDTIGFEKCVSVCLSNTEVRCLNQNDAMSLRTLNGWRNAAHHYYLVLPESQLYMATQGATTLFDDLLRAAFGESLRDHLPERVLPISVVPPRDIGVMLDDAFVAIGTLLAPGRRKVSLAKAQLRPIAILEAASNGSAETPSEGALRRALRRLQGGEDWRTIFPGASALRLESTGSGLSFSLRLTKNEGLPIQRVADDGAAPLAERRVAEHDFYNLGLRKLHAHFASDMTEPRLRAVIAHLGLKENNDYFKELIINGRPQPLYSQKAIGAIQSALPGLGLDVVWAEYQANRAGSNPRGRTGRR